MASFHFAVQVLGRSKGHNAVAAAAYRARCELRDHRAGAVQDYRRKEGLQRAEILLPDGAAPWLGDREQLWNHVEAIEKRRDAQLAREINMALPAELTDEQRFTLVREFIQANFVERGMVADVAWHRPVAGKGDDPRNYHAHIMLTLRQATPSGLRRVKTREWNSDAMLEGWRVAWCQWQNRALERGGHAARVDHRSLAAQRAEALERGDQSAVLRLERDPEIHMGPRAQKIRERGLAPRSRTREAPTARSNAGRWRSAKQADKRRRAVDYRRIDRGDRTSFNAERVALNARRYQDQLQRCQFRSARLRVFEARALRAARDAEQGLRALQQRPGPGLRSLWGRAPTNLSVQRQVLEMKRSTALNRVRLSRLILGRVEGVLSGLFMDHERTLSRRRTMLERSLRLDRLRVAGRDTGQIRERH